MPEAMLSGRLDVRTRDLAVEEVPKPSPGPGEVLVRVAAAGICLSDVHLIEGQLSPLFLAGDAVTLGHEVAGTVAELGDGMTGATVGQRVLLQAGEEKDGWMHTRGVDYDGGWAEYALATVGTLVPVPDGMPLEQACIVPDGVSTPWASIVRTAGVRAGQPVGVWGIGGLGAHAVQLLRLAGAAPIVAVDPVPAARAGARLRRRPRPRPGGRRRRAGAGADRRCRAGVRLRLRRGGAGARAGGADAGARRRPGPRRAHRPAAEHPQRHPAQLLRPADPRPLRLRARARAGAGVPGPARSANLSRSISGTLPLSEPARGVEVLAHEEGDPIRLVLTP
nr:alcohol dehydrogenase catalytic domain-containing protein [Geodermatophilus obscurus]